MRVGRNLTIGLVNSIWSAVIAFAVVPIYLKYLGAESYGLIGFYTTTQVLITLLDLGLSSTINREVARNKANGGGQRSAELLHTLAVIYWGIALLIGVITIALAPWISEYWLKSQTLPLKTLTHSIMLIGLVISCRWPIALYQGALIGAEEITLQSKINITMVTLANAGATIVLMFISPTIEAYFLWQVLVGAIYVLSIRFFAWKVIGNRHHVVFSIAQLKNVWRFSVGMSTIGILGIIFNQLDKLILSKVLHLEDFGHYMLATTLVSSLYLFVTPFYNAVYPRFSSLSSQSETSELSDIYRASSRLLSMTLFPIAMILTVFPQEVLLLWTGNVNLSTAVAPIVAILAIGSALHGIMYIPHALQLAHGMVRIPIMINSLLMVVIFPLTIFLTTHYGTMGGAYSWLILHILYFALGSWLTHKNILSGTGRKWLVKDIGIPASLTLLAGIFAHYLTQKFTLTVLEKLSIGVFLCLCIFAAGLLLSPTLTQMLSLRLKTFRQL